MRKLWLKNIAAIALMFGVGGTAFAQWAIKGDYVLRGSVLVAYQGNDTAVNIPGNLGITEIGEKAFSGNARITSVIIPQGVTSIGDEVFAYSGLTSVTIPASVDYIGEKAFDDCYLTAITVDPRNTVYSSIDGVLFDKAGKRLIQYPSGKTGSYAIPAGVISIKDGAFAACHGLTSVTIPSSITSIGVGAFFYCSKMKSVTIPAGVTYIGEGAFNYCRSLTSVTISQGVVSIGDSAFAACGSLTSVSVPASVTYIGKRAFASYFPGDEPSAGSLTAITVDPRNTVYSSIDGVLFDKAGKTLIQYPSGKTGSYAIPAGVISIRDGAFSCGSMTSVTIPTSIAYIENSTFSYCKNLTSVTIPSSVTSIGKGAFEGSGLTSVIIPSSVTYIGEYAFPWSLKTATLSRRTQVAENAFPEGVRLIYSETGAAASNW